MITIPPETKYTIPQLGDLLTLYVQTKKKFAIKTTDVTYEAILAPEDYIAAFFEWIEFNEGKRK